MLGDKSLKKVIICNGESLELKEDFNENQIDYIYQFEDLEDTLELDIIGEIDEE